MNQREREGAYQCEDSVAPTADKIEVVGSNMPVLCKKAMASVLQYKTDLILMCTNYKDITKKELLKHMRSHK